MRTSSESRPRPRERLLVTCALLGAVLAFAASPIAESQCEVVRLANPDNPPADLFAAVALAGDVAVIGDPLVDEQVGAVYVFRRDGLTWTFEQKLVAPSPDAFDSFAVTVATTGTVIVVGAPQRDAPSRQMGAIYVFRFDGVSWSREAELTASDGDEFDSLGHNVAIAGKTLVSALLTGAALPAIALLLRRVEWMAR